MLREIIKWPSYAFLGNKILFWDLDYLILLSIIETMFKNDLIFVCVPLSCCFSTTSCLISICIRQCLLYYGLESTKLMMEASFVSLLIILTLHMFLVSSHLPQPLYLSRPVLLDVQFLLRWGLVIRSPLQPYSASHENHSGQLKMLHETILCFHDSSMLMSLFRVCPHACFMSRLMDCLVVTAKIIHEE